MRQDSSEPRLIVVAGVLRGQQVDLVAPHIVVGRSPDCDAMLDEPTVSRRHAIFQRRGHDVYVQDLGSTAGTTVNGDPLQGTRVLRGGDLLSLAAVDLRYEPGGAQLDATSAMTAHPAPPHFTRPPHEPDRVEYNIDGQHADVISNIGRDQYVQMERESFLREIAATRSRARTMIWIGFILTICGFVGWASVVLSFIGGVESATGPNDVPALLGPTVAGVPAGVFALGAALTGMVLLIVGIVLHVVAAARRRGLERQLPLAGVPSGTPRGGR
jgi:hypothetical protein